MVRCAAYSHSLCVEYLGVDAKVGQRSQFGQKWLSVGLHSTFNVPLELVGLWIWIQQAEGYLITWREQRQGNRQSKDFFTLNAPSAAIHSACPTRVLREGSV